WGLCENLLSPSQTSANELLYLEASVQGQSFIAAAGDAGSQDCAAGSVGVDSPASQPSVLGVGGTSRVAGADQVWNTYDAAHPEYDQAGGGGISTVSCMAFYQEQSATVPGIVNSSSVHDSNCNGALDAPYRRQVPDVSAIADPSTGYPIYHNGQWQLFGGTSAAAPLWASIGALIDASPFCSSYGSGFPGVQVSLIYKAAGDAWSQTFTDVTVGNNDLHHELGGLYSAATGYDEASGLGTPLVVGLDDQGVARIELPGLAARICKMAASTNKIPAVSSFTPSAILPGSPTTVTIAGEGFLTIAGSTVLHLDADHSVIATCTSSTSCTFNSGSLSTKTYSPTIEVEKLASSSTPTFTVTDPTSTTLVVTASPSATSYGAQSTLRGVVSPSGATGSVTFTTGATVLCTGTITSGTASCSTPKALGVGTYEVLGNYAGAGPFAASSGSTSLEITRASSSVTVSAAPAAPLPGATVVLTARVTPSDATGTVHVSIGNGGACTATLSSGVASCSVTAPTLLGSQPVRAVYQGDALREASNTTGSLTVQRAVSSTSMTRPMTPVSGDGASTWSAAVTPSSATGSVTFSAVSGGVTTGRCTAALAGGRASCSAAVLARGSTIKVTATYSGSNTVSTSSATATYAVAKVATTFKVAVTPAVVPAKKPFTISVSGLKPQTTGVVTFKVGAVLL
ncbi:MAG: Ig-like domain repeat protein, partial [Actinomycetes bacterium]